MKVNEVADVVQHPAMARLGEYNRLLKGTEKDMGDIVDFIMDDKNSLERRLGLLRKLDDLLGTPQETYSVSDLEDFMKDPSADSSND